MLPNVNEILYVQVNSIDELEAKQEYQSRIIDVHENFITMEVPIHETSGRLRSLYPGDELSVYFVTKGDVKNFFTTSVLDLKEDVTRLVVVKKPASELITQVPRRNFLRVPAQLEIAVKSSEQIQFVAVTGDVGGGGVCFFCENYIPLKENNHISCWLLFQYKNGLIEHIPFKGEMVRIVPLENGNQQVMVRFAEISDRDRQKVIKFCFERQLEFRKK